MLKKVKLGVLLAILTVSSLIIFIQTGAQTIATFGETSTSGGQGYTVGFADYWKSGSKFTLTENGNVTKMTMYFASNPDRDIVLCIYDDDGGSGKPGTLICKTETKKPVGTGWIDFAGEDLPFNLDAGDYILTCVSALGGTWLAYMKSATGDYIDRNSDTLPPSDPWGRHIMYTDKHLCIYATYTLGGVAEGTLGVDTTPISGEVFVNETSWGMAPQSRTLQEGTYNVSFGYVAGYVTPPWQIAIVAAGDTTNVTGTYEPMGTLSVDTTPVKGEVFVDGVSWGIAPQARMLTEGTYMVSFGDVSGYVTPSSQEVDVTAEQTTSVLGTYESMADDLFQSGLLLELPYGSTHRDYSVDTNTILHSLDLDQIESGDQTVVFVSGGSTINVTGEFQTWDLPDMINQVFFIYSWTPSWPPPSSTYYYAVYNGVPGPYPGVRQTFSFNLTVPNTPSVYYLYFCSGANFSIELAVNEYNQPLWIPYAVITTHEATVATTGTYLQYAEKIAQKVQEKMWDPLYGGYFEIMDRSWDEVLHPHKEFIYTYWQKAFCYLYDRTGNATYLDWARKITDVEIAYAWDSVNGGWYDEYNRTWGQGNLPRLRAYIKTAGVQGSMINMLLEVYSRTGNSTYYEYAVKTADFLITNFHDPVYGGFYRNYNQSSGQPQDTGKGIEDSYGQVSYGLLKLYELTQNSTYLNLSREAMDFTINHLWDSTYGGWLTEVDRTGSVIVNDRKYPNEEIWPVFGGFAYYYKITGNLTALNYVSKTMDYIDSKLWDPVYGGWFRSLWRNNTIRDDTKTAWDLAGEPWMIWEVYKITGNITYQEMARKSLDWVLNTVMYDTVYGGVVTEVDRTGTTITDSVKDVECHSDAIASFSYVADRDFTPINLTGNLLQAKYLAEKVQQYMWDERYGGYFWTMNRTWSLKTSDKTSTMLIIMGLLNLYKRSGNTTYLVWAENAVNFLLSNAWDKANGGVYDIYNRSWSPKTTVKTLQRQAELLRVLIDLYTYTNHQRYYDYANKTAEFILARYHDDQYGGQYKTYDQETGAPVTTNKDAEVSLGSFGWGMMHWYSLTENSTALEYTREANDFIWTHLRDEIYGGLITEVDRTGSVIVNDRKYPNVIIWGTLGMLEYYRVTGNTTVKGWVQELFSYVRNVMWDPSYGGWFRSLWRNNTIRHSTKEGWSQTEQPWFWWFAYSILGDDYYADIARLSVNWTRTYLYDLIHSGFFLELYQNGTLYDDDKVDSVEGAGISALTLVSDEAPVGTLVVDTTPVEGEVFADGVSWGIAPQSRTVPEGNYTVSFGDFLGYVTPLPQNATVVEGETTSVLGTYEPGSYVVYADELAQLIWKNMKDETYGGYYSDVSKDWTSVINSHKDFEGNVYIAIGYLKLYERTGNTTYLDRAEETANLLWTKAWNKTANLGFFNTYYPNWTTNTDDQYLQMNAEFVILSLDLYDETTNSTHYVWANQTMHFVMDNYHDDTYGAMYQTRNGTDGTISDTNKDLEYSLGSFALAAMKWYGYTSNETAKTYSQECIEWMRHYHWNSTSNGYVVHPYFHPDDEMWGLLGMAEFYKQTNNETIKSWMRDGLNHINNTMWDTVYGGWYHRLKSDNSTEAYWDGKTGWDAGRQPWNWYCIYEITDNSTDRDTAIRSLDWTIDNVWDQDYGGIWLECYRNTTKFDSKKNSEVEGAAIVAFSYVVSGNWDYFQMDTVDTYAFPIVGRGRNDSTYRVYFSFPLGDRKGELWEYTWNTSSNNFTAFNARSTTVLGASGDISIGYGRNDTTLRIYVAKGASGIIEEYTWNSTNNNYTISQLPNLGGHFYTGPWVGRGRNDSTYRVYIGLPNGTAYELTCNGVGWDVFNMGSIENFAARGVSGGYGRNDSTLRVYFGGSGPNAGIYEFSWNQANSNYTTSKILDKPNRALRLPEIGYGRNDTTHRIYGCAKDTGEMWELTWNGTGWNEFFVGSHGTGARRVRIADGRNDRTNRLYVGDKPTIYELTWNASLGNFSFTGNITTEAGIKWIWVGPGRNDSLNRIYVNNEESGTFWLREYSYSTREVFQGAHALRFN